MTLAAPTHFGSSGLWMSKTWMFDGTRPVGARGADHRAASASPPMSTGRLSMCRSAEGRARAALGGIAHVEDLEDAVPALTADRLRPGTPSRPGTATAGDGNVPYARRRPAASQVLNVEVYGTSGLEAAIVDRSRGRRCRPWPRADMSCRTCSPGQRLDHERQHRPARPRSTERDVDRRRRPGDTAMSRTFTGFSDAVRVLLEQPHVARERCAPAR